MQTPQNGSSFETPRGVRPRANASPLYLTSPNASEVGQASQQAYKKQNEKFVSPRAREVVAILEALPEDVSGRLARQRQQSRGCQGRMLNPETARTQQRSRSQLERGYFSVAQVPRALPCRPSFLTETEARRGAAPGSRESARESPGSIRDDMEQRRFLKAKEQIRWKKAHQVKFDPEPVRYEAPKDPKVEAEFANSQLEKQMERDTMLYYSRFQATKIEPIIQEQVETRWHRLQAHGVDLVNNIQLQAARQLFRFSSIYK